MSDKTPLASTTDAAVSSQLVSIPRTFTAPPGESPWDSLHGRSAPCRALRHDSLHTRQMGDRTGFDLVGRHDMGLRDHGTPHTARRGGLPRWAAWWDHPVIDACRGTRHSVSADRPSSTRVRQAWAWAVPDHCAGPGQQPAHTSEPMNAPSGTTRCRNRSYLAHRARPDRRLRDRHNRRRRVVCEGVVELDDLAAKPGSQTRSLASRRPLLAAPFKFGTGFPEFHRPFSDCTLR